MNALLWLDPEVLLSHLPERSGGL